MVFLLCFFYTLNAMQILAQFLEEIDQNPNEKHMQSPFYFDHEIARALIALKWGKIARFKSLPSGAVPLFEGFAYKWSGLPYPRYHAQLACLIHDMGLVEQAEKMAQWQLFTVDHHLNPFQSFYTQERTRCADELREWTAKLFEKLAPKPLPVLSCDQDLGIVRLSYNAFTAIAHASGCLSGMGSVAYQDISIVNYGPQLSALGDCSAFGLAGRGLDISIHPEKGSFEATARLGATHLRPQPINGISDGTFAKHWLRFKQRMGVDGLTFEGTFERVGESKNLLFVFFLKAPACFVSGSHKLNPKSLDRYVGPASWILLEGKQGNLQIEMPVGAKKLEVIPLAGDENFWNADFIAAYTIESSFAFNVRPS